MHRHIRSLFAWRIPRRQATTTRLRILSLEDRHVPSGVTATFDFNGDHVLRVFGTDNPDNIVVLRQAGVTSVLDNGAAVSIDAEAAGFMSSLPPGWLAGINIYGQRGDDRLEVRTVHLNSFVTDIRNNSVPVLISAFDGDDTVFADNQTGMIAPVSLAFTVNPTTVYGGNGADIICGGLGSDSLYGGADDDEIYSNNGNDFLSGGYGNDRLFGGAGNDLLDGGPDNDWLEAGSASETAKGGGGLDFNAHQWSIGGTDRADIDQGMAHTCSLMSTLAAASAQGYDLTSNITYDGDYHYSVRMFDTNLNQWVSIGVVFDGTILRDGDGNSVDPDLPTVGIGGTYEFWTVLYQRAWLSYFQHKDVTRVDKVMEFTEDLNCARTVQNVTGKSASTEGMPWFAEDLQGKVRSGAVVTAGGTGHRYAVLDVFQDNGEWKVKVFNPRAHDKTHDPDDDGPLTKVPFEAVGDNDGVIYIKWSDFTNSAYFKNYTFTR